MLTPNARKSYNHYKPIIVYTEPGTSIKRTEVLGRDTYYDQYAQRTRQTFNRGLLFDTREAAVEYARGAIQARIAAWEDKIAECEARLSEIPNNDECQRPTMAPNNVLRQRVQKTLDHARRAIASIKGE